MSDHTSEAKFGEGFRRVDDQQDPQLFFKMLDVQAQLPGILGLRAAGMRMVNPTPGMRVLDIGCGTGEVARDIAARVAPSGSVVGIDFSAKMIDEAQRRTEDASLPVEFAHGDAQALTFGDDTFDAVRIERTLQHLADPGLALEEMIRVSKPGGVVVALDTDWESAVVDIEDSALMRRYSQTSAARFAQPSIGRRLFGMFVNAGLLDVAAEPAVFCVAGSPPGGSFKPLHMSIAQMHGDGAISDAERDALLLEIDTATTQDRLFFAVMMFAVSGKKPA